MKLIHFSLKQLILSDLAWLSVNYREKLENPRQAALPIDIATHRQNSWSWVFITAGRNSNP